MLTSTCHLLSISVIMKELKYFHVYVSFFVSYFLVHAEFIGTLYISKTSPFYDMNAHIHTYIFPSFSFIFGPNGIFFFPMQSNLNLLLCLGLVLNIKTLFSVSGSTNHNHGPNSNYCLFL